MRKPIRFLSLMLVVSILGCCACSKKKSSKVTHENLIQAAKNHGAEEADNIDIYNTVMKDLVRPNGNEINICFTGKDSAQENYDQFVNMYMGFPKITVKELTVFTASDKTRETFFFAIALTAKDEKQAKKFFENRNETFSDSPKYDSGETDGYTYAISYSDSDQVALDGVYLKDNTAMYVRCYFYLMTDDGVRAASEFYKDLGLISPCDL